MKLSRFYCNQPKTFEPIDFRPGLNVILAEIKMPENRRKDTHNLGKTTLGRLLDFGLLAGRDAKFFLFKHLDVFRDFVFFTELELIDGSYVTVRRSVGESSKIAFKKHSAGGKDFTTLPSYEWDHYNVPFERAKELLDSLLDWRALKPWSYRKGLGYFLRSQDDYGDVFHLRKFASRHADWKPFLAHVLGFDATIIKGHYAKEQEKADKEASIQSIKKEVALNFEDASKVDGIILLKTEESLNKQELLDSFDFESQDKITNKELVEEVENEIARLNYRRYSLTQNLKKIVLSLNEGEILFSPDKANKLFEEVGILFPYQITKTFDELIAFNRAITEERREYLQEERADIEEELEIISAALNALGRRRSEMLSFLSGMDAFAKYKNLSSQLVTLRADIAALERQRGFLHRLQQLRTDIRNLSEEITRLHTKIEEHVESKNLSKSSLHSTIRLYFSEIVEEVLDRKALLSVSTNRNGHIEFRAEILDEAGNSTSADLGHTYRKLLCIAFDMSILRAWGNKKFPKFVYHDGVFESLDDRKKENLLSVVRRYADLGIQSVITLIDTDLPVRQEGAAPVFDPIEIVLRLHDEGESGRLFKMPTW